MEPGIELNPGSDVAESRAAVGVPKTNMVEGAEFQLMFRSMNLEYMKPNTEGFR